MESRPPNINTLSLPVKKKYKILEMRLAGGMRGPRFARLSTFFILLRSSSFAKLDLNLG